MAAGFDKNAEAIDGALNLGFGFVELGTVTPMPQIGNKKPRVFKIPELSAVIQRLGFNNKGVEEFLENLKKIKRVNNIIGVNIGKNKKLYILFQTTDSFMKNFFPIQIILQLIFSLIPLFQRYSGKRKY